MNRHQPPKNRKRGGNTNPVWIPPPPPGRIFDEGLETELREVFGSSLDERPTTIPFAEDAKDNRGRVPKIKRRP